MIRIAVACFISLLLAPSNAAPTDQLHFQSSSDDHFLPPLSLLSSESSLISAPIRNYIEGLMERWDLKGVSLSVIKGPNPKNGKGEEWQREATGFGVRNRFGEPMQNDTLMAIASNSKLFLSTSIGMLIHNESATYTSLVGVEKGQQKRLTWETKVADVVPEWKLMDENASKMSNIIDLLAHRTGMPRHDLSYTPQMNASAIVSNMRYLKPSTSLREHWQYNNMAYVTASLIPEIMTGQPWPEYVKEHIFDPLGMKDSRIPFSETKATGREADGYAKPNLDLALCLKEREEKGATNPSKKCLGEAESIGWWQIGEGRGTAGAGGVAATAADLSLWLQTLLTKGVSPTTGKQVIPVAVVEAVAKARSIVATEPAWEEHGIVTYGLAQERYTYRGFDVIEHGGSVPGQMSQVIRLPNQNIGVSVVVNDDQLGTAAANFAIKWRVIDELLGLKPIDWETRMYNKTLEGYKKGLARSSPAPSNITEPSGGFDHLQGTYTDKGYGDLTFCIVPSSVPDQHITRSAECDRLLSIQPFPVKNDGKARFVASTGKIWTQYMQISHFDGNHFNVSTGAIWPDTGAKTYRDDSYPTAQATFVNGGVGFAGNFWGSGEGVPVTYIEGEVESEAEVFFRKVGT